MSESSRFLLGMALGADLILFGFLLGGAGFQDEEKGEVGLIRARSIEIVDALGTEVLIIGANRDGGSISVRNALGHTVLIAGATEGGGVILTRDGQTRKNTFIAGAQSHGGHMQLFDRDGRVTARLTSRSDDAFSLVHPQSSSTIALNFQEHGGVLRITGRDHAQRFRAGVGTAGHGMMDTFSASGHRLVSLSATASEHGQIRTFGNTENDLIRLTATTDNEGYIATFNAEGRPLTAIATQSSGPTIRVFNQHGEPAVSLQSNETGDGEIGMWRRDGTGSVLQP